MVRTERPRRSSPASGTRQQGNPRHLWETSLVGGPAAWSGPEIAHLDDWLFQLDDAETAGLLANVGRLGAVRANGGMAAVAALPRSEVVVAEADGLFARMRRDILEGRGLALIRGLPVDGLSTEECELLAWCVGIHLGVPIHQNPQGDLTVDVIDQGKDFAHHQVRAYETAAELNYHSDSSDIVGLLCIRPAAAGGVSTVVSSTRAHDELVRRDPAAAELLYEPWWHFNPADGSVAARPICARKGGELFTHYGRRYLDLGAADPRTPVLDGEHRAALDLFDEMVRDPKLVLDMHFRPGDLQLLNNYKILHSRTEYVDHPDPQLRRHLLRIWLVVPELEAPPEFVDVGIIPRTVAFSGPG